MLFSKFRLNLIPFKCGLGIFISLLLMLSICFPVLALADDPVEMSATGTTDLYVELASNTEKGGTSESKVVRVEDGTGDYDESGNAQENGNYALNPLYNPDTNGDGYGDNIAFSVPTAINFTLKADGDFNSTFRRCYLC